MHSEIRLPQRVTDYLSALGVPVRVMRGNAWLYEVPDSWRGAAGPNNTSLEDCRTRGLTIVSWGTDARPIDVHWMPQWPGQFFGDGQPRDGGRDWVLSTSRHDLPDSFTVNDQATGNVAETPAGYPILYARTRERAAFFHMDLEGLHDDMDLDLFFGPVIQRALSTDWAAEREERDAELVRQREEQQRLEAEQEERRRVQREERLRQEQDQARERFIAQMRGSTETRIQQLERQISDCERSIRSYEQSLSDFRLNAANYSREVETLRNADTIGEDEFMDQWRALLEHPHVENITISGSHLVIHTDLLEIEDPDSGETAPLGNFQIKLPAGPGAYVELHNTNNRIESRDHPHVEGGIPCWGGSQALMDRLREENQLPALFEFCLQYLESYNPADSWGRAFGRYWFSDDGRNRLVSRPGATATPVDTAGNPTPPAIDDNTPEWQLPGGDPDADCNCQDCRAERLGYDPER